MSFPGLTIFATAKPPRGHTGVIQRNAIGSWKQLQAPPEIYLFGNDQGTTELAAELQVSYLKDIASNEFGTPLLNDLLRRARTIARRPLVCYVNSDIILLQEFQDAVCALSQRLPKFLCVARRLNVDITAPLTFGKNWRRDFESEVTVHGTLGGPLAVDVFAFPRELYFDAPPLVLGRAWFDQWLIKAARTRGVPVIDVSRVAQAIHQNHDYLHIEGGQEGAYWGEEARRNLVLYGGTPHAYTLLDVTHELMPSGQISRVRFRRSKAALQSWLWGKAIAPTAELRKKIGLRRWRLAQKKSAAKV